MNKSLPFVLGIILVPLIGGCSMLKSAVQEADSRINGSGTPAVTAGGATAGVAIGSTIGKGKGQAAAMAAGGLIGAWTSNAIYERLTAQDRDVLKEQAKTASTSGQVQTYKNPETGTEIKTRVATTETKQERVSVPVLKDRVYQLPPLELVGQTYAANADTDVRSGPGMDYRVVDRIKSGQPAEVIGRVKGQPWFLIGASGVASGYMPETSLRPAPSASPTAPTQNVAATGEVDVVIEREYRTVEQQVTLADGNKSTEQTTIRAGSAGWEVVDKPQ